MTEVTAYLGLGTNLGDREQNLRDAVRLLGQPGGGIRVIRASRLYDTAPWGMTGQPDFLNCALEVITSFVPRKLLARVKGVEAELGRVPGPRNGPRLIDVDILLYGSGTVNEPDLEIPHPRLHLRAFALVPLAELAGGLVHPVLLTTIEELVENSEGLEGVAAHGTLE